MSLIKLCYDNRIKNAAIKLTKVGKDALIKRQVTTMKQVVEGRTN